MGQSTIGAHKAGLYGKVAFLYGDHYRLVSLYILDIVVLPFPSFVGHKFHIGPSRLKTAAREGGRRTAVCEESEIGNKDIVEKARTELI